MQGTLQRQRNGITWMRIGFATSAFRMAVMPLAVLALVALGMWIYLETPATSWRLPTVAAVYLFAALLYLNLGVWLHEQFHCLVYRGTPRSSRVRITYFRRSIFALGGFYRVTGSLDYSVMSRALLGPLYLTLILLALGVLGSLLLPHWWLPLMLSLVVVSLLDMLHDLYMYSQIRRIGPKAKYWDRGRDLELVWRA